MLPVFVMCCVAATAQANPASIADCRPESGTVVTSLQAVEARMSEVRTVAFPELAGVDLRTRTFHSQSDYFRTRFSLLRFVLPIKMRYFVEVNPALFGQQAPPDGVCAVLAHELSHASSLSRANRIRRLELIRLLSAGYTTKFERRTDLEAIHRGYGDGLKSYRKWVYAHIPPARLPAKRRNYFSPEEIDAIQARLRDDPGQFQKWFRRVPLNLQEILYSGEK
jgi:hypothetical protein